MANTLFNLTQNLYQQISVENLNIHSVLEELNKIIQVGKKNSKLRIITYFVSILEVVARNYKYEDATTIVEIKDLIKRSLELLLFMVDGKYTNQEGADNIIVLIQEARTYLVKKLGDAPCLLDHNLLIQFAEDLQKDIENLENLFVNSILLSNEKYFYENIKYYLYKISDQSKFIGIIPTIELTIALLQFIDKQYQENHLCDLATNTLFIQSVTYYKKLYQTIFDEINNMSILKLSIENIDNKELCQLLSNQNTSSISIKIDIPKDSSTTLTHEEISALMNDEYIEEIISFDDVNENDSQFLDEKKLEFNTDLEILHEQHSPSNGHIENNEYYTMMKNNLKIQDTQTHSISSIFELSQEEELIRYIGRLFQKQEQICLELSHEKKVEMIEDLHEIQTLTSNIRQLLFNHYSSTVKELFGNDLRKYIYSEVQSLNKKIKLGIQGEDSELLSRMSDFVKHIIFTLVKNSLHYSIEPIFRRKAIEKNEIGWLLIEFDENGDMFDIYVKDDGKGIISEQMNLTELEKQIQEKDGTLLIDAVENEYLKIHVQLPMKKILSDCLVIKLGDTNILIPSKCVDRIVEQKELVIALRDENCIGHINLSVLLGLSKTPVNMLVVCKFHGKKIIFGVDQVLYNLEALIETVNVPLLPYADFVSIIKDGSLGFVLNERKLERAAKNTIMNRKKVAHSVL